MSDQGRNGLQDLIRALVASHGGEGDLVGQLDQVTIDQIEFLKEKEMQLELEKTKRIEKLIELAEAKAEEEFEEREQILEEKHEALWNHILEEKNLNKEGLYSVNVETGQVFEAKI